MNRFDPVRRRWSRFALLCLAIAASALAAADNYLAPGQVDLTRLLPSPPRAESPAQARDLAAVLEAQNTRSPEQAALAIADAVPSVFRFADVLGPAFKEENLPRTAALFRQIGREASVLGQAAKRHWNRPRPFTVSADVKPLLDKPENPSYPSNHAMFGYLAGLMLANMVPEQRDALIARGTLYGDNRVTAGVHFPSDAAAGRIAATAIAAVLLQNPRFMTDFETATKELQKVLERSDEHTAN